VVRRSTVVWPWTTRYQMVLSASAASTRQALSRALRVDHLEGYAGKPAPTGCVDLPTGTNRDHSRFTGARPILPGRYQTIHFAFQLEVDRFSLINCG
jgi:hypothetical protein